VAQSSVRNPTVSQYFFISQRPPNAAERPGRAVGCLWVKLLCHNWCGVWV